MNEEPQKVVFDWEYGMGEKPIKSKQSSGRDNR